MCITNLICALRTTRRLQGRKRERFRRKREQKPRPDLLRRLNMLLYSWKHNNISVDTFSFPVLPSSDWPPSICFLNFFFFFYLGCFWKSVQYSILSLVCRLVTNLWFCGFISFLLIFMDRKTAKVCIFFCLFVVFFKSFVWWPASFVSFLTF